MSPRKRLATLGERGNLVRLFLYTSKNGTKRYVVMWGPKISREQESWPNTKEGKIEAETFFKAFGEEATKKADVAVPLTNRQLWDAYTIAEFKHLRPNTQRLYSDAWRTWEQFATPTAIAEETSITTIHSFRDALDARGLATATVQDCIRNVRIVFNWGERMELIARNRWHLFIYKVAKEKRTKPRAEFTGEEFLKVWAGPWVDAKGVPVVDKKTGQPRLALDPNERGQWRAWVAVGLLGIYGNRANEILNLRWSWIAGDVVTIDPEFVKTGEEGVLRLFPLTRSILAVARRWRAVEGYKGDCVLFPGQREKQRSATKANPSALLHYSIQSLTDQIHRAERRAGLEVTKWKASHAFRRGLVGDLADETGDIMLALQAIRDKDIRMAQRYRSRRESNVDRVVRSRAERLMPGGLEGAESVESAPEKGATEVQPTPTNDENSPQGAVAMSTSDKDLR